jgi:hypothetical protein
MKCTACAKGPHGGEGHVDLFVHKMQGNRIQFYCRTCSSMWMRTNANGCYSWSESTRELDAAPVPGGPRPDLTRR